MTKFAEKLCQRGYNTIFMGFFNKLFGKKDVDNEDVFQLNVFLAYTFFPSAIESYNKGDYSIDYILKFIPILKQNKSQWNHLFKLIKVTDSGLNYFGIRTIIIELPHNHPLAKAHILIIQQNENHKNAKYYILEKELLGEGYMLCSADSLGNHTNDCLAEECEKMRQDGSKNARSDNWASSD